MSHNGPSADGKFTAQVPITDGDRNIFVNFVGYGLPYYLSSSYDTPVVTIKPRATKVVAAVTAKRVKSGESITVSGTASWKTPDGWAPVSAGQINVSACNALDNCNSFSVVPVAADGTYTLTVTPFESTTLRSYYIPPYRADGRMDPYVATSQRDVPITVLQKSSIPRFTASRESSGAVHLHGSRCCTASPGSPPSSCWSSVEFPDGHLTPVNIPVEFQFSETGTGDWLTLDDDDQSYWDGEGGYEFEGRMTEPRSGWWRARYPGDPANFQASTSNGVPGQPGPHNEDVVMSRKISDQTSSRPGSASVRLATLTTCRPANGSAETADHLAPLPGLTAITVDRDHRVGPRPDQGRLTPGAELTTVWAGSGASRAASTSMSSPSSATAT